MSGVGILLVDEQVHVFVARLVGLLKLVIEQLRVIDAESTMLAAHPRDLVNHVET